MFSTNLSFELFMEVLMDHLHQPMARNTVDIVMTEASSSETFQLGLRGCVISTQPGVDGFTGHRSLL